MYELKTKDQTLFNTATFLSTCISFIILLFVFQFISSSFLVYTAFSFLCMSPGSRNNPSVYKSEGAFWAPAFWSCHYFFLVCSGSVWTTMLHIASFVSMDENVSWLQIQIFWSSSGSLSNHRLCVRQGFFKMEYIFPALPASHISFPPLSPHAQKCNLKL